MRRIGRQENKTCNMKSDKSIFIFMGTVACVLLCFKTSSTKIDLEQAIEQQLEKEQLQRPSIENLPSGQSGSQILKRKRRYLEFPEGSSFQLVYDLIVGVVDFTNYLILGVTVALAWELPSKPPSEIFNDISERLKDGTLGTSRIDTVENIKYIDLKANSTAHRTPSNGIKFNLQPMFRTPMHYQYYTPQPPDNFYKYRGDKYSQGSNLYAPTQYNNRFGNHSIFYTPRLTHPFEKWTKSKTLPKFSVKGAKYPWWNLHDRLKSSFISRPNVRRFGKNTKYIQAHSNSKETLGTYSTHRGARPSFEHRVYPVFGKRSIPAEQTENQNSASEHHRFRRSGIATEHLSKLDRIHIEHHRRTRHDLYQRIETYLNGRGSHGHHCVLRALCETGQKAKEHKPGSFVGELMRAIFTMPEPLDSTEYANQRIGYKEQRYDVANALKEDCASRYTHCKDSLWSSHFVL